MATVTVRDESLTGALEASTTLEFPTERITVRELIRERVYQEVQEYNRARTGPFRGLVQPAGAAEVHDGRRRGFAVPPGREVDWKEQFDKACTAFEAGRVLVLVGDRQTESLDDMIELTRGVEVSFLKLVPLVGG